MSKTYYELFSVRAKKKSISTRIERGVLYFNEVEIKIYAPKPLSIKQSETTIAQTGNITTITVFFKGGEASDRMAVLDAKRVKKHLVKDLSNDEFEVTDTVEFIFLWNEYDNITSAARSSADSDSDPGGKGGGTFIGG